MLIRYPKDGGHKAWKTRAAAQVGPTPRRGWRVAKQLGRVEDMPAPNIGQAISTYQVDPILPPSQQRGKFLETLQLLGRDAHFLAKFIGPVSALLRVAFHVKRRRGLCWRVCG